jgi:hypothetical protein
MAIKLHFTTATYDFFKYGGKYTKISPEKFEHRKDRYFFHKLDRLYPTQEDLIFFLAVSFFSRNKVWVRDLLTEDAREIYLERKKVKESLLYMTQQGFDKLELSRANFRLWVGVPDGGLPKLLLGALQGDIREEIVIVLGAVAGCWSLWDQKITDTIVYPAFRVRCIRYAPFLELDVSKFRKMVRERLL